MPRTETVRAGFPPGPTRTIIVEPLEKPERAPAPAQPKRNPERRRAPGPSKLPARKPAKAPAGPVKEPAGA